jgi:hypothetical protein
MDHSWGIYTTQSCSYEMLLMHIAAMFHVQDDDDFSAAFQLPTLPAGHLFGSKQHSFTSALPEGAIKSASCFDFKLDANFEKDLAALRHRYLIGSVSVFCNRVFNPAQLAAGTKDAGSSTEFIDSGTSTGPHSS